MKAQKIYNKLKEDFVTAKMTDSWFEDMKEISDFITDDFKERSIGLVCDFTDKIEKIYTAVFSSNEVMQKIIDDNIENAMLFVHHPMIWDITDKKVFLNMNKKLLQIFKERKISIYNLHSPLDNFSEYSTAYTLAEKIEITNKKPFCEYNGGLAGVFGKTTLNTVDELVEKVKNIVGHQVVLYNYGNNTVKNNRVAVVAGGGNDMNVLTEIQENNINILITGVTAKNEFSKAPHDFAKKHNINIIGATHYSTEKFACIKIVKYFKKLGVESEFISEVPMMEDL